MSKGSATVTGGGHTSTISGQQAVGVGYRITVTPGSLAALRLAGGRDFEIAPGEVAITTPDTLQLVTGTVLAQLSQAATVDVPGASATTSSGVFRVDGGGPTRVAVYSGSASASVSGNTVKVPAFRQVEVVNGQIQGPSGLQLVGTGDAIDLQLLSSAISLEGQLDSFANGLDAQLGTAAGAPLFAAILPAPADVAYVTPYLSQPQSDVLIGWEIAYDATVAAPAQLGETFNTVMALWLQGEPWGVVADEYHVSGDAVFQGLERDLDRLRQAVSPQPASSSIPTAVSTPKPKTSPSSKTKSLAVVTPTPTPVPTPSGLGSLLDPVTGLLSQILNLLLPQPGPSPTPSPGR